MAKHMECGCWLTDDLSKVEGVCEAHKQWQMAALDDAYNVSAAREREACAAEMDRRASENANTEDARACYRNAARAIRTRQEG